MSESGGAPDAFEVLDFWWSAGPARWFSQDDEFDRECRKRVGDLHEAAAAGRLDDWKDAPHSCLALILLLDQMPRNIHRGTPRAFATDAAALRAAEHAAAMRYPLAFPAAARTFFYLPYMHAEDVRMQERCVDLFRALGEHNSFHYALIHHEAIARFGRFPHRNEVLGRETTAEERAYLEAGGFSA